MNYLIDKLMEILSKYSYIKNINEYMINLILGILILMLAFAFYIVFDVCYSYKEIKILKRIKNTQGNNDYVSSLNKDYKKRNAKKYKVYDDENTKKLTDLNSNADTELIGEKFRIIKIHKMYESGNTIFDELDIEINELMKEYEKGWK